MSRMRSEAEQGHTHLEQAKHECCSHQVQDINVRGGGRGGLPGLCPLLHVGGTYPTPACPPPLCR